LNEKEHGTGSLHDERYLVQFYGSWAHGQMHGYGHLRCPEGIYQGNFSAWKFDGEGKMVFPTGGSVYTG